MHCWACTLQLGDDVQRKLAVAEALGTMSEERDALKSELSLITVKNLCTCPATACSGRGLNQSGAAISSKYIAYCAYF